VTSARAMSTKRTSAMPSQRQFGGTIVPTLCRRSSSLGRSVRIQTGDTKEEVGGRV
jgi:hypothetical protein